MHPWVVTVAALVLINMTLWPRYNTPGKLDAITRQHFNHQDLHPVFNLVEPDTKHHSGQSPSTSSCQRISHHVPSSLMYASRQRYLSTYMIYSRAFIRYGTVTVCIL